MPTVNMNERGIRMLRKALLLTLVFAVSLCSFVPTYAENTEYTQQIVDGLSSSSLLQLKDGGMAIKGLIDHLEEKGYLQKGYTSQEFTEEIEHAVKRFQSDNGLEPTGMMDNTTLTLLLQDRKESIIPIYVFIPTDGGKRYHGNPYCSEMSYPRIVSLENAITLGFTQCRSSVYRCSSIFKHFHIDDEKVDQARVNEYIESFIATLEKYFNKRDILENGDVNNDLIMDDVETTDINRAIPTTQYIGNKNSHVFHDPSCNSVKTMKQSNQIMFSTRDEAIQQGYKPCSRCSP